jgi:hypothetical protein
MRVTITRYGMSPEQLEQEIELQFISIKNGIQALALETQKQMQQNIVNNIHRPDSTGNLVRAITVEYFENGAGIGNIEYLKQFAPYWAALNYGSSHLVGKWLPSGIFRPGTAIPTMTAFREGRWRVGEGSDGSLGEEFYTARIKNPIIAINYIEKTANWLSTVFKVHFYNRLNKSKIY